MLKFLLWIAGPLGPMFFFRAQAARQATLLWTLAVAVEKQVPLAPFLEALGDEAPGRWRWMLRGLAGLLHSGSSIPDALDAMPGLLPVETVAMIRVGAETGRLGPALR
ncbi:MAG TPA: type II secretion system F family protein, partial [Planctomycetaceae bacterium]|nr:type II secretion system F family protein [Planctomycetaceae bacterium]